MNNFNKSINLNKNSSCNIDTNKSNSLNILSKEINFDIDINNSNEIGGRIDKLIYEICKSKEYGITRTRIQDLIKNNYLSKNGEDFNDSSYKVKLNDKFNFIIPEIKTRELKPKDIPLNIIYEDDDILVVNKQIGLTTHPGAGNEDDTLVNALLNIYGEKLSDIGGEFRPGIVHRLDKNTTGLIVIAKNNKAHISLSEQLKNRTLKRNYIGFLWGVLNPKSGKIEGYIERSKSNRLKMEMVKDEKGRYSLTNYGTLKTFLDNSISMVEFSLDTGRTHQIRVHCSSRGCPLIGDSLYGGSSRYLKNIYSFKNFVDNFSRQALHSYKISFIQPTTNKLLKFEIPLPEDMKKLLEYLQSI